jgi:hypothetical protein
MRSRPGRVLRILAAALICVAPAAAAADSAAEGAAAGAPPEVRPADS